MLSQLIEYSQVHFMSEQLCMRIYAFPAYNDHVHDYESMIEHLNQIKHLHTSGQINSALDTAKGMRNFLPAHISSRDQAFICYLSNMQSS